jgi:hypothetical protein
LFRGRIVGAKLNNRRSLSMPGYMRFLEWQSMRRTIHGIQLCEAAKAVAKPGLALDTCAKLNMFRGPGVRRRDLTKSRYAGDDLPPHWRFGDTTLSWLSRLPNSGLEELK